MTLAVWLVIGVTGTVLHGRIDGATAAGQASFLPKDSESTRALDALEGQSAKHGAPKAEEVPAVIVFNRQGGLTQRDLRAIGRLGVGLNALDVTGATPVIDAFTADSRSRSATSPRTYMG